MLLSSFLFVIFELQMVINHSYGGPKKLEFNLWTVCVLECLRVISFNKFISTTQDFVLPFKELVCRCYRCLPDDQRRKWTWVLKFVKSLRSTHGMAGGF